MVRSEFSALGERIWKYPVQGQRPGASMGFDANVSVEFTGCNYSVLAAQHGLCH